MTTTTTTTEALAEWQQRQDAEAVVRARMSDVSSQQMPDPEVDEARARLAIVLGEEKNPAGQLAALQAEHQRVAEAHMIRPVIGDRYRQVLRHSIEQLEDHLAREARQRAQEAATAAQEAPRVSEPVEPLEARVAALEAAVRRYGIPV